MMGVILLIGGCFFAFKCKQAMGRGDLNDAMSSVGQGSFVEMIKAGFFRYLYGILALIGILGGLSKLFGEGK